MSKQVEAHQIEKDADVKGRGFGGAGGGKALFRPLGAEDRNDMRRLGRRHEYTRMIWASSDF